MLATTVATDIAIATFAAVFATAISIVTLV
jgi:hypothetical protein